VDTIIGSSGNDSINGGLLGDTLTGNGGSDTFVYSSVADSPGGLFDTINDFTSGDKIDLTAFRTTAFTTFKTGTLASATNSILAHTIAWFYDSATNKTIIYANPTKDTFNGGDPDLLEIHLTGDRSSLLNGPSGVNNFLTANPLTTTAPAGVA